LEKYRKKKKLGSYPFISVIFSISVALSAIGIFGLLAIFSGKLSQNIRGNVQIQVYLDKSVTETERIKIQKTIADKEFVMHYDGKPQIEYVSKEEAAEIFIGETGEDFSEFLGDNPLRDAFTIVVSSGYQQTDSLKKVRNELASINGVYEITYVEDLINSINNNFAKISVILLIIATFLIIAIITLINNTIKLALFSQRFLIRSMQLVGAKTSFIIRPFLTRSFFHGVISALLASLLIGGLVYFSLRKIPDVMVLIDVNYLLLLFAFLVALGIVIAVLSTYRAVNKYLRMSLDELY